MGIVRSISRGDFRPLTRAITEAFGGSAFSPASLFSGGEQGGWYDYSDMSTLFQDSAGSTPVTAVEQPIGLVLDKSKGLARGSELVLNGDFSTDTVWSKGTGWTISGGVANNDGSSAFSNLAQNPVSFPPAGSLVEVVVDVATCQAGATGRVLLGGSQVAGLFTTPGIKTFLTIASATVFSVQVDTPAATGFSFSINSISFRLISGNHLIQATSAARPVWSARKNLIERTDDFTNAAWSKTNVTVSPGVLDPDGGSTAFTITSTAAAGVAEQTASIGNIIGTMSVWMRRRTGTGAVKTWNGSSYASWGTLTSAWQRVTVSSVTATTQFLSVYFDNSGDAVDVWRPQLEVVVATPTRYQRVTTSTDYDTAGFPHFARYDGVDDFMGSGTVPFAAQATDKMSVFVGNMKAGTGTYGVVALDGLGGAPHSNCIYSAATGGGMRGSLIGVGIAQVARDPAASAGVAYVHATLFDVAGATATDEVKVRQNGTLGTQTVVTAGPVTTANFADNTIVLGNWATTFPLDGRIYQAVIRAGVITAQQITDTEAYITAKTVDV